MQKHREISLSQSVLRHRSGWWLRRDMGWVGEVKPVFHFHRNPKKRSFLHLPHTQKPLHSLMKLTQIFVDFDTRNGQLYFFVHSLNKVPHFFRSLEEYYITVIYKSQSEFISNINSLENFNYILYLSLFVYWICKWTCISYLFHPLNYWYLFNG